MKSLLMMLACVAVLTAQIVPNGQVGIVQGTVVRESTSEPIAGVKITIGGTGILVTPQLAEALLDAEARGQYVPSELMDEARARESVGTRAIPPGLTAVTDADGRFAVKDVPVGNARVYAQLEGYFAPPVNGEFGSRAHLTALVKDGEATAVKLSMVPAATLSGKVLDPSGKPLFNSVLQLLRPAYITGNASFALVAAKPTDDRGEYRVYPVPPGEYYVAASSGLPGAPGPATATLYPNADRVDAASKIVLAAGKEMTGVDVHLRSAAASTLSVKVTSSYALSGVTSPQGAARATTAFLSLVRHEEDAFSDLLGGAIGTAGPDGTFQFTGLTPGIYDVYARLPISYGWGPANPPGRAAQPWGYGRTTVEVRGGEIKDVPVVVHQGPDIKGRVTVDGKPQAANLRLTIAAQGGLGRITDGPTANTYAYISRFAPPIGQDGSFTFPLVPEGHYRFAVRGLESLPNAYVADIRQGPVSVYDNGVHIRDSAVDAIEVAINTNGGSVEVTVVGADQKPAAAMTVVLVPAQQRRQNPSLYKTGRSDPQGRVLLTNLAPGSYKLFAWDNVPPGAWMNADFIGKVEERGTSVTINAGARQAAQAKAIVR